VFGREKKSVAASLDDITDSLAETKSARKAAQEAASRAARAADRSEQKAIKAAAAQEQQAAAQVSKEAAKQRRAELKAAKALAAQTKKVDKNIAAAAKRVAPKALFDRATDPKTARRLLGIVKVVGPAVAPFALKAATSTREYLDTRKASRLGVAAAEVGAFRGPTGSVEARLAGLTRSVEELRARRTGDLQVTRFSDVASDRLTELTAAVRAAASMPAGRRRDSIAAVNRELNQIDADLMTFLVGR